MKHMAVKTTNKNYRKFKKGGGKAPASGVTTPFRRSTQGRE
jgi:hypothetical protein